MPKPLHTCMTKATTAEGDQRKYGPNWVTARRGMLRIYEDQLECGNWNVSYPEIQRAVLTSFRSLIGLPGYILMVETNEKTFHFGLNGWGSFWKGELPFEVVREKGKLGYHWLSIVARVALVAYFGHEVWQWIRG